ncbi:MAG: hypothetical protein AB1758_01190 [Candidatus Eremiobacterota bacterium]
MRRFRERRFHDPHRQVRPTLAERLPALIPSRAVLVALALLGAALLWAFWESPAPSGTGSASPPVRVVVQGRLQTGQDLASVRLILHLPEVPLDVEKTAAELVDAEGRFRFELELHPESPPRTAGVEVRAPGCPAASTEWRPLSGEPLSVTLPDLTLKKAP